MFKRLFDDDPIGKVIFIVLAVFGAATVIAQLGIFVGRTLGVMLCG